MVREEEIEQVAKDIARKFYNEENPNLAYRSVRQGILWADQHPRKGLWDAKKVIDYIYNHAHVRTFGDIVIDNMSVTEFIKTMEKAMER